MDGSEALNRNPDLVQPQNFMVIREDYFVHHQSPVFPPTRHEDLPVESESSESSESPESSEPFESPESSSPAASDLRSRAVREAIMRRCAIFKAKVISRIFGFGSFAVSLCSALPVAAMAALLVLLLFSLKMKMKMRLPWRPPTVGVRTDNEQRLLLLLKDKDHKISQLLVQIGQMNETLSAGRKVPVVRIK